MNSTNPDVLGIDLGSNTFRCIAYDCKTHRFGAEMERIVKTADAIHETSMISEGAIERIIAAAKEADALFDFSKYEMRAFTTAAMRMAHNRDTALKRIASEGGVSFQIIDASIEAELTMLAVRNRLEMLKLDGDDFVLIDIGGGSTEVMFYKAGRFITESFPVGIVTVAQQCESPEQVRTMMRQNLKPVEDYIRGHYESEGKPKHFVATAGTPTTIASFLQGMTYATYDPQRINGTVLTLDECGKALVDLIALDDATRAEYVGVGKETLIVAGVVIVEEFYRILGFDAAVIIDDGLREGIVLDYCRQYNLG
jgi:exopolyphosphatase/guanosine-5'-triphosphate,3'-diphosphate pyrophosphatase